VAVMMYVDFPQSEPFGEAMSAAFADLARSINDEPGMIWKIWTENQNTKEAGGIYCFDCEENAQKYLKMHSERLAKFGYTDIRGKIFDINLPLSMINKANFLENN